MGGGLMQLVAYGAQDIYLSGNPQITFWKVVYRRHTNFSMEAIDQQFNGSADWGKKVSCTVSRNGDLIHRVYVQVDLPKLDGTEDGIAGYEDDLGHKLIASVECEVGGQRIDKHYGEWLHIWNELSQTSGHWDGYSQMINGVAVDELSSNKLGGRTLYIPLQFWFCRNPGLALPLIALQYHEVKLVVEFAGADTCVTGAHKPFNSATLYVDYIYLDTDERRRFAQVTHEYLIEQLQFTGEEKAQSKVKLNFNHPCKELVWVMQADQAGVGEYIEGYEEAHLQLNGHDRTSSRKASYYQLVQPYQHHERVPSSAISVYSFALRPEEHQPSGSCNMSRIDNATLNLKGVTTTDTVKVFATNYNVLRIMSGMGGLSFSS